MSQGHTNFLLRPGKFTSEWDSPAVRFIPPENNQAIYNTASGKFELFSLAPYALVGAGLLTLYLILQKR